MALNFPNSPAPGQVFTAEGVTFIWNGAVWRAQSPTVIPWATPAEARAGVIADKAMSPLTTKYASRLKAWGNFDGVNSAVRKAENLTMIRTATGDFTFTMPTPMLDLDYAVFVSGSSIIGAAAIAVSLLSVSQFTVVWRRSSSEAPGNPAYIFVQVLGE